MFMGTSQQVYTYIHTYIHVYSCHGFNVYSGHLAAGVADPSAVQRFDSHVPEAVPVHRDERAVVALVEGAAQNRAAAVHTHFAVRVLLKGVQRKLLLGIVLRRKYVYSRES